MYIQKDATAGYAEDMIHCIANGAVKLFYDGGTTPKLETTSSGAKVNGNLEVTGSITPTGAKGQKGEPGSAMIQNSRTSSYTLVASDDGKLVTTNSNVTVPQNVFSAPDAVTIVNNSSANISIIQASGVTLRLTGTTVTGNRTLAPYGMASIICVASNVFFISGGGLT